jgi:hypothetical protein
LELKISKEGDSAMGLWIGIIENQVRQLNPQEMSTQQPESLKFDDKQFVLLKKQ